MSVIGVRLNCKKLDPAQIRALRTVAQPYYSGRCRVFDCLRSGGTVVIFDSVPNHQALICAIACNCHEVYDRIDEWMGNSRDDYVSSGKVVSA